ncbi:thioesterase family protein [Microbacterium sp. NPDC096154]|uniref:thioesterase family protein n=1 Tax=Microbacterium sp. NPDC096154 TaxID=3155549 RepID=UPI0033307187
MSDDACFVPESPTRFRPTEHVGGGWNPAEQHVAPGMGLLAHAIERDRAARGGAGRDGDLRLARFSCEILGTIPLEPVDVEVSVLRPGRTIELVEARLVHAGRPALIARAWLTAAYDTTSLAGTPLPPIPAPGSLPEWRMSEHWPGGFARSVTIRRREDKPGRAAFWLRPQRDLIAGVPVSTTARLLGVVDLANGVTPRASGDEVFSPNLDLAAHLIRQPAGEWIGCDTAVSFGPHGAGLTHTVLHDERGPLGTVSQGLTVRPR